MRHFDWIHRLKKCKVTNSYLSDWTKTTFIILAIAALAGFFISSSGKQTATYSNINHTLGAFPIVEANIKYGFELNHYKVTEDQLKPNQFLADILINHKVDYQAIDRIAKASKDIFDVRNLRANKPYTILTKDTTLGADYFIYEPNVYRYVIYDLKKETIEVVERPIVTEIAEASGVVETSLWNTMVDNGLSYDLTARMEDALAWTIDFHHIQKGDRFKLVFEQNYIDGEAVGVGEIKAALYETGGTEFYAIRYENDRHNGFYDLEGRSMEKAFLKAPVKYSRISSRYNGRGRFHPILKRRKAHLGTDYAAPRGTPIFAVADGRVTKRTRTRGNGNYVKIKHDDIYQTQYLHMSKFAKGVNVGTHVKQGQVIGYVGSTGLATGPHVCFRFWKNGKQVNHLKENLPPPEPMPEEERPKYILVKEEMKSKLDQIPFPGESKSEMSVNEESKEEDNNKLGNP